MAVRLPGTRSDRIRGVALALVVLSTLAFWPGALDRWVLPKVLVVALAVLVALVAAPRGRLPRWLWIALAAGVALLVVTALAGEQQPLAALLGRWPRYEGVVTAGAYLAALWLGARLLGPHPGSGPGERVSPPTDDRLLDRLLAAVAIVLGVWTLLEAGGLRPLPSDLDRPGALLGNATDQGAVAAALAVVLLARVLAVRRSRAEVAVLAGAAALAAGTVVLSGSRAALLALVVGVLAAAMTAPAPRRVRVLAAAVAIGTVSVLAVAVPAMSTRLGGLAGDAIAGRLLIWRETLDVVAAHPLLGTGPNGFLDAVAAVHGPEWFAQNGDTAVLDSPHNLLLQALVVAGPLGLVGAVAGLVALTITVVRRIRAASDERRALVLPAALGAGVLVLVLFTHVTAPATCVLAALLLGAAVARERPRESRRGRFAVAVAAIAWTALVTTALAGEVAVGAAVTRVGLGLPGTGNEAATAAAALRPWDVDTPILAAQAYTDLADREGPLAELARGDVERMAAEWSRRAWDAAPTSLIAGRTRVVTGLSQWRAAGEEGDPAEASRQLDEVASTLDQLRARFPRDPWVAHRAGAVALAQGEVDAAEELLLLATRLDPTRADPWLTLAFLYEQQGDATAAAEAQAMAEALSP